MGSIRKKVEDKIYEIQKRIIYVNGMYQFTNVYFDKKGDVIAYDDLINFDMTELILLISNEMISIELETLMYELKLNYNGFLLPVIDIEKERQKNKDIRALTSSTDYFEFVGVTKEELEEVQNKLLNFIKSFKN